MLKKLSILLLGSGLLAHAGEFDEQETQEAIRQSMETLKEDEDRRRILEESARETPKEEPAKQEQEEKEPLVVSPFEELPQEIHLMIFGWLSPKDLGAIASVNQKMNILSQDDTLWQSYFMKDFPKKIGMKSPKELSWKERYHRVVEGILEEKKITAKLLESPGNDSVSKQIDPNEFWQICNNQPKTPHSQITNDTPNLITVDIGYALGEYGQVIQGNLDTGSYKNIMIAPGKMVFFKPASRGWISDYSVFFIKESNSDVEYHGNSDHFICSQQPLRHITFTTKRETERFGLHIYINLRDPIKGYLSDDPTDLARYT